MSRWMNSGDRIVQHRAALDAMDEADAQRVPDALVIRGVELLPSRL